MPYTNARGHTFTQIFEDLPFLSSLYPFEAERSFSSLLGVELIAPAWPRLPLAIVSIYLLAVWGGQKLMAHRAPLRLKWSLAAWNGALALFSFLGACRTVPQLLFNLATMPMRDTVCLPADASAWGNNATGLWVVLFVLSKVPELGDTLFLVLRKRSVIFLHWYHHVTVLLYCWHAFATEAPQALYFVAMNYSVHAVMYTYYACSAAKIRFPLPPYLITVAQISQMVVGVAVQGVSARYFLTQTPEAPCAVTPSNLAAGGIMYGSYLLLFVSFAFDRFRPVTKSSPRQERSTGSTGAAAPVGKAKRKGAAHLKQP